MTHDTTTDIRFACPCSAQLARVTRFFASIDTGFHAMPVRLGAIQKDVLYPNYFKGSLTIGERWCSGYLPDSVEVGMRAKRYDVMRMWHAPSAVNWHSVSAHLARHMRVSFARVPCMESCNHPCNPNMVTTTSTPNALRFRSLGAVHKQKPF